MQPPPSKPTLGTNSVLAFWDWWLRAAVEKGTGNSLKKKRLKGEKAEKKVEKECYIQEPEAFYKVNLLENQRTG